jgi:hypothetical protein
MMRFMNIVFSFYLHVKRGAVTATAAGNECQGSGVTACSQQLGCCKLAMDSIPRVPGALAAAADELPSLQDAE